MSREMSVAGESESEWSAVRGKVKLGVNSSNGNLSMLVFAGTNL